MAAALTPRRVPSFVYVVPTFNNPTGRTLVRGAAPRLVRLWPRRGACRSSPTSPTLTCATREQTLPPLAAIDSDRVIQLGTFSKTLAPGLRLGWVERRRPSARGSPCSSRPADLHTSTFTQRVVAKLLERFDFDGHLVRLRVVYVGALRAMHGALAAALPRGIAVDASPRAGSSSGSPSAPGVSEDAVFKSRPQRKVAVVPGGAFFVQCPSGGICG